MTSVLFLDDSDEREDTIFPLLRRAGCEPVRASNIDEFRELATRTTFDVIMLDHDLNDHPEHRSILGYILDGVRPMLATGVDAAELIVSGVVNEPKRCIVHSLNLDGAKEIEGMLLLVELPVWRIEFDDLVDQVRSALRAKGKLR